MEKKKTAVNVRASRRRALHENSGKKKYTTWTSTTAAWPDPGGTIASMKAGAR